LEEVTIGLIALAPPLTWEVVYQAYGPQVARWAARLAGPSEDVEDLVHEVFLVVEARLPTFVGTDALPSWLFRITHNVVRRERRKQRIRRWLLGPTPEEVAPADPRPDPLAQVMERQEVARLYQAMEHLKEPARTVLILHELEGLSAAEISGLTGIAPGTIWVQLHRARQRLAKILEETP
jgi:RNA polymerase sigma-70 factor (ECF subfamily)